MNLPLNRPMATLSPAQSGGEGREREQPATVFNLAEGSGVADRRSALFPTHEPERGRLARRAARMAALQFRGTNRQAGFVDFLPEGVGGGEGKATVRFSASTVFRKHPLRLLGEL
jgi:hypothetical protein